MTQRKRKHTLRKRLAYEDFAEMSISGYITDQLWLLLIKQGMVDATIRFNGCLRLFGHLSSQTIL